MKDTDLSTPSIFLLTVIGRNSTPSAIAVKLNSPCLRGTFLFITLLRFHVTRFFPCLFVILSHIARPDLKAKQWPRKSAHSNWHRSPCMLQHKLKKLRPQQQQQPVTTTKTMMMALCTTATTVFAEPTHLSWTAQTQQASPVQFRGF